MHQQALAEAVMGDAVKMGPGPMAAMDHRPISALPHPRCRTEEIRLVLGPQDQGQVGIDDQIVMHEKTLRRWHEEG